MRRLRQSLLCLLWALACAGGASGGAPQFAGPLGALERASQAAPRAIPREYRLLERVRVPATTPFNRDGPRLKTQFREGATYYLTASGTAFIPSYSNVALTVDAIYCVLAEPPAGNCPPAAAPGFHGGVNLIWFRGKTFQTYGGSEWFGRTATGWLKYRPSHRYEYRFKAPFEARLMLGGPQVTDNRANKGGFALELYGKPAAKWRLYAIDCDGDQQDAAVTLGQKAGCARLRLVAEHPDPTAYLRIAIEERRRNTTTGRAEWVGIGARCRLVEGHAECRHTTFFQSAFSGRRRYRAVLREEGRIVDTSNIVVATYR